MLSYNYDYYKNKMFCIVYCSFNSVDIFEEKLTPHVKLLYIIRIFFLLTLLLNNVLLWKTLNVNLFRKQSSAF
jgi:hypothetical protein